MLSPVTQSAIATLALSQLQVPRFEPELSALNPPAYASSIEALTSRSLPIIENPWEDLKDAIVFNMRLFFYDPRFNEDLKKALEQEKAKLTPGETKQFYVYVTYIGGEKDWPKFAFLSEVDKPSILPADVSIQSKVRISQAQYALADPLLPISKAIFDQITAQVTPKPRMDYWDFSYATQISNIANGFKRLFDLDKVAIGDGISFSGEFLNLLDRGAYAPDGGKIILLSKAGETKYQVFNTETSKVESYDKGGLLKAASNTVYILLSSKGREYLLVYRNLDSVTLKPGDETKLADPVGAFAQHATKPNRPQVEFWRIPKPADRFLATANKPDGAFLLWKQ